MSSQAYEQRAASVLHRIEELAAISEDSHCVTRTYGTEAFRKGRELVEFWMQQAGLETRTDQIGNVRGRLVSKATGAKTFVIASHIDTVVNAGKYDGPLGVLLGIELLAHLIQAKAELPFHLELIAFADEEGVRFHTTYLGSKVVAGTFDASTLQKKDGHGITLSQAIAEMGGDTAQLPQDALKQDEWLGYFELHIEQGPVLYKHHLPVAVVTAIAGQMRVELGWKGFAGHAGTVPMHMRQDALCAAAEFVLAAEAFALAQPDGLVATVGKLHVSHAASNVIPGDATSSLDLRCADEAQLSAAYRTLQQLAQEIATRRKVQLHWNLVQQGKPVTCDASLSQLLTQAIADSGNEVVQLVSGAGHDAVPISEVAPVTMLFIRCYKGISHNPLENVEASDIAAAIQVADRFLELLILKYQRP